VLEVRQLSASSLGRQRWSISWQLISDEPLAIDSLWLPHSRFRAEEIDFSPPATPDTVDTPIFCDASPGEVIDNAFLILRAGRRRIFVRLRIEMSSFPRAVVEAIT